MLEAFRKGGYVRRIVLYIWHLDKDNPITAFLSVGAWDWVGAVVGYVGSMVAKLMGGYSTVFHGDLVG